MSCASASRAEYKFEKIISMRKVSESISRSLATIVARQSVRLPFRRGRYDFTSRQGNPPLVRPRKDGSDFVVHILSNAARDFKESSDVEARNPKISRRFGRRCL